MDLALIAIIVSFVSAITAGLSLGWNIYRDVVIKPRVKVNFDIRMMVTPGAKEHPEFLIFSASNFGPGPTTLNSIHVRNSSLIKKISKKEKHAIILHDRRHPLSADLPYKLEIGDRIDIILPYDEKCLLKEEWSHIGIYDSYGKNHWTPRIQVKKARERWLTDFNQGK